MAGGGKFGEESAERVGARDESVRTLLPGIMEMVLRARSTRNVRNPAKLPTSIPIVAYPLVITTKSSQFHGLRRYVYLFSTNPLAIIFITISAEYITRKMYLERTKLASDLMRWRRLRFMSFYQFSLGVSFLSRCKCYKYYF